MRHPRGNSGQSHFHEDDVRHDRLRIFVVGSAFGEADRAIEGYGLVKEISSVEAHERKVVVPGIRDNYFTKSASDAATVKLPADKQSFHFANMVRQSAIGHAAGYLSVTEGQEGLSIGRTVAKRKLFEFLVE